VLPSLPNVECCDLPWKTTCPITMTSMLRIFQAKCKALARSVLNADLENPVWSHLLGLRKHCSKRKWRPAEHGLCIGAGTSSMGEMLSFLKTFCSNVTDTVSLRLDSNSTQPTMVWNHVIPAFCSTWFVWNAGITRSS
jgi:hypothetical protein